MLSRDILYLTFINTVKLLILGFVGQEIVKQLKNPLG